jgi:hypothetical protein
MGNILDSMLSDTYRMMLKSLLPGEMRKKMGRDDAGAGIKFLMLGGLLAPIIGFIILSIPTTTETMAYGIGPTFVFLFYMFVLMLVSVLTVVVGTAVVGISATYKIAKVFGSKATYGQHLYIFGLICGGFAVSGAVFAIIPLLGLILLLLQWIYSMYLAFVIFSELHKLDWPHAAFLGGLPLVAGFLIALTFTLLAGLGMPMMQGI